MVGKNKEPKGFIDIPVRRVAVLDTVKPAILNTIRQMLVVVGHPDFDDLVMKDLVVGVVDGQTRFYCEYYQSDYPDFTLTQSMPENALQAVLTRGSYYLTDAGFVRHYRVAKRYKINCPVSTTVPG